MVPAGLNRLQRFRYGAEMNWASACAAVIPCLNEAASIAEVVRSVRAHLDHVVVVDDGSNDETSRIARSAGAEVLRHESAQGKGAAQTDGWRHARQAGFGWALSLDGDGQHAAADIPKFLKCADRTGASMVVGNRMDQPAGMPWLRRQVNRWMSRRLSKLTGQDLPDTQNGFRLMDLRIWSELPIQTTHFEIESEILLSFALRGHRVEFVPVQVIYGSERSKIHVWRDTVRWFRWWRKARQRAARQAASRQ